MLLIQISAAQGPAECELAVKYTLHFHRFQTGLTQPGGGVVEMIRTVFTRHG